jgi:hypothetical protein
LETNDFGGHNDPCFARLALQVMGTWLKAVYEERTCPNQIILGAMDSDFCIVPSFAIYLEQQISQENGRHCKFVLCHNTEVQNAGEHVINKVQK